MVRMPDTTGQLRNAKDVPVRVLRGLFAGIGHLLLAADRFRAEEEQREGIEHDEHDGPPTGLDGEHAPHPMTTADYVRSASRAPAAAPGAEAAVSERGRHRKPAEPRASARTGARKKRQPAGPRTFRSLDATGNVRVLTADMPAESSSEDARPAQQARTRKPGRAAPAHPATVPPAAEASLPVPGFDGLSLASVRARLRNLDAAQVRTLLEHERSAGNRADVVGMLERRAAKLEALHDAP